MQGAEVDQDVDEGVLVGDGPTVAQFGALDAGFDGLGVDALGGGALLVDILVDLAFAVELVANASADTGGQRSDTALGPVPVLNRAGYTGGLWENQGAGIATPLVPNNVSTG